MITKDEALRQYGAILKIADIMQLLGVGRVTATKICAKLDRRGKKRLKGERYEVMTARFYDWTETGY